MSKIEKALRKSREAGGSSGRSLVQRSSKAATEETAAPVSREKVVEAVSSVPIARASESAMTIPFMQQPATLDVLGRQELKIIYPEASENATIKALREIRTKVLQQTASSNCVIMVTGTSLGSGASFVSMNLGAAFSLDAARTSLLVDCNIRDPSLHRLVTGEVRSGLTNYLTNSSEDIADIILPTGVSRMRVIPAGVNIDPTVEYFTMDRMRRLIRSIRERYPDRNVILDCPPISRSADTQILLELCDYVLVIVPYGRATPSRLQSALKLIDGKKLLGVILNQEPSLPAMDWKNSVIGVLMDLRQKVLDVVARCATYIKKRVARSS